MYQLTEIKFLKDGIVQANKMKCKRFLKMCEIFATDIIRRGHLRKGYIDRTKVNNLITHHRGVFASCFSWALIRENLSLGVGEQQRRRPACAFAQTDQHLYYLIFEKYHNYTYYRRNFKFLSSLCR